MMQQMFLAEIANVTLAPGATDNYNVYTAAGSPATHPKNVFVTLSGEVGSTSTGSYAFDWGTGWMVGSIIDVISNNAVMGKGGAAGAGGGCTDGVPANGVAGSVGGPAMNAAGLPANLMGYYTNNNIIAGGGGGGGGGGGAINLEGKTSFSTGGSGGGGGRGRTNTAGGAGGVSTGAGFSNTNGNVGGTGTSSAGGTGGATAGHGGGAGGNGAGFAATGSTGANGTGNVLNGTGAAGAAGGNATNGDSKITFRTVGTITGSRVG